MLLKEAQVRFGPPNRKIRFKVQARESPVPQTVSDGTAGVIVYYAREAKHDPLRLRFQLAHEVVHCLSGALKHDALKLEEGFAVYFSLNLWANDPTYQKKARDSLPPLYREALELFTRLNPSDDKIKKLRSHCANLDQVRPELLTTIFGAPEDLARELCTRIPTDI